MGEIRTMRRGARVDVAHREACVNVAPTRTDVALINGVKSWHYNPSLPPKSLLPRPRAEVGYIVVLSSTAAPEVDTAKFADTLPPGLSADERFDWDPGGPVTLVEKFVDQVPHDQAPRPDEVVVVTVIGVAVQGDEGNRDLVQEMFELVHEAPGRRFAFHHGKRPEEVPRIPLDGFSTRLAP